MSTDQPCYITLGSISDSNDSYTDVKIKEDIQSNDVRRKTEALKRLIRGMISGEKMNNFLIPVIQYVMPNQDHGLKKLLLLFWEVVPKYSSDGKLLTEMILVCDAYRKDLQHPNEFVRGSTLRFLCKLKEPELIEPLMPSILQCLEHRHSYVKRNAVLAIFTIYQNFEYLIPNAPEKILNFLEKEQDASCRRNAFMMLLHASQQTAVEYLYTCIDQVSNFGDIMQLIVVELIYKVCHANPTERARFIRCVYNLLHSSSPAVRYEAAGTLVTLSAAPTAIKSVTSCYIDLVLKESDNNVKLIVLDRLMSLRDKHEKILQDNLMDIMRILGASDMEVRTKTLELCLDLITGRTVEEFIGIIKKELVKCYSAESGTASTLDEKEYRYHLIHAMYQAVIRYPDMIPQVIPTVCEILTYMENNSNSTSSPANEVNNSAGDETCKLLREVIQRFPQHRTFVLEKIMETCLGIKHRDVLRHCIWIMGEFCSGEAEIQSFMNLLAQMIGPLPLVDEEMRRISGDDNDNTESALMASDGGLGASSATKVTADGTYATQSALTLDPKKSSTKGSAALDRPTLQAALFLPDYMPAVILSVSLVKLFCRYSDAVSAKYKGEVAIKKINQMAASCMLPIASMIHLAKSKLLSHQVNADYLDRMWFALKALSERNPIVLNAFDQLCKDRLLEMIRHEEEVRKLQKKSSTQVSKVVLQPDDAVHFTQLANQNDLGDLIDRFDFTLNQALLGTGFGDKAGDADFTTTSKLSKVTQLTGFSDPVFAEAYVHVNQYDILLDILIVNQTTDTLQNLTVELATLGDLKLVEKPSPVTLAAQDFCNIKASIKVTSSENGIIFGNIVYDVGGASGECNCVVMNDIHIDIMEYIQPASCSAADFRSMWNEFEWENKVTVNTKIKDLKVYLNQIITNTNMRCLNDSDALAGESDYLCVTLFAKSIFGENVLANLCLEKPPGDQSLVGHLRIRAKTQGMAVTMGEKITATQKQTPTAVELPNISNDKTADGAVASPNIEGCVEPVH